MIGLDCNILVQLAFADHPANAKTVAAVKAEVERGSELALPPLIATEFLHIVTDARRFDPPFSMPEDCGGSTNSWPHLPFVSCRQATPACARRSNGCVSTILDENASWTPISQPLPGQRT